MKIKILFPIKIHEISNQDFINIYALVVIDQSHKLSALYTYIISIYTVITIISYVIKFSLIIIYSKPKQQYFLKYYVILLRLRNNLQRILIL